MTRNGKIARLPREIRERLNHCLNDGQPGKVIVDWLNEIPEVGNCMDEYFDGRPITEQNLSEWKKGGYQDWLEDQQARDAARKLCEQGDALAEESGLVPLSDRLSSLIALVLGRMLQKIAMKPMDGPEQNREFLALARELALHRRCDHNAALLRLELEREQKARADERKRQEFAKQRANDPFSMFIDAATREATFRSLIAKMPLDEENKLRKRFGMAERSEPQSQAGDQCKTVDNPTESD